MKLLSSGLPILAVATIAIGYLAAEIATVLVDIARNTRRVAEPPPANPTDIRLPIPVTPCTNPLG